MVSEVMGHEAAAQLFDCMKDLFAAGTTYQPPAEVLEALRCINLTNNNLYPCVIVASNTASPQPEICWGTMRQLPRCGSCNCCQSFPQPPVQVSGSQIPSPLPSPSQSPRPMETQSCSGTAGVSAAAPMASPESQTDEGCGLPLASVEITDSKIGSEHQIGAVFADRPPPRQMINMFGNRYKDLALGAYNLPDTAMASAPSSSTTVTIMPAATYNLTEKYIAKGKRPRKSKRNPKGAIKAALKHDVRKRGPLPECPGIGNKPPIRYGKSTVFFSPAGAV